MRPFTIAHISDLHLSPEYGAPHILNTEHVLDYILQRNVDHIVLTGDIAASAEDRDFQLARKILGSFGLLDSSKLTVVVGNHDIYGGVHTAEDILTFPGRCRATRYERQLALFRESFHETFDHCLLVSHDQPFPFVKILGDVMLLGLNSVRRYSTLLNPIGSNGEVDEDQTRSLKELLSSPIAEDKRKIVLIHHHFCKVNRTARGMMENVWGVIERRTMKLHGRNSLTKILKKGRVEVVLHGHLHENIEYTRDSVRFLNAGGCIVRHGGGELTVNFVKVSDAGIGTEIHTLPSRSESAPHIAAAASEAQISSREEVEP